MLPSLSSSAHLDGDRHKTISFEKTVYTKIKKKIQPASSNAFRKFREQVLQALNLKYACLSINSQFP